MMGTMGYIAAIVLVAFLLPLGAFLYLDILKTKNETKRMLEKIEKIEKRLERKSRDKEPPMSVTVDGDKVTVTKGSDTITTKK